MAARNQLGRIYQPGKPLPDSFRGEILDLYNRGFSKKQISRDLQLTTRAVRKIIRHFQRYGTLTSFSHGGSEPRKVTDNVLHCMEIWKLQKPTIYVHEIRNRLYLEGICDGSTLPSESSIQHCLHDKLGMTRKKVCQIPTERAKNIWKVDDYLQITQGLSPTTLHFFDEASVVKTTSNCLYGSSYRGMKAVEVQRYASNATYTVNLSHSVFGVDYYNIIPGASNGEELIAFFDYALECERSDGLPVFLEGDTLIMDNCGFHHGRTTERALRTMLATRGVTLLFQPPYSPNLNTCEYCFHQMKEGLRQNEYYSQECTEMAIMDSLNSITATQSVNYFRHCGYIY